MVLYRFLDRCRSLLVIPIVGCAIVTAATVIVGFGRIGTYGMTLAETGAFSEEAAKKMSLAVLEVLDLFLVGVVAYITAVGLYKLFLSDEEVRFFKRMRIESLNDLEAKIIGVLVTALGMAFLGHAVTDEPGTLLNYGAAIALVIAALSFYVRQTSNSDRTEK